MQQRASVDAGRLSTVADRLVRMHRRTELPGELSPARASTLYSLVEHGPRRLGALAALERISQPAMTQIVQQLEASGLLERQPDPADGRASLIAITDAGRALSRERIAARAVTTAALLDTLDADDAAAIARALPALERLASAADAVHPPR
ncbi:MarR family winged helix-turn-helix transcriptional regulator [Agrococcus baldri]|uniref:MarR family transcriptional regulator n=1 Tax=Agrococcus baldri TaxID=153730 RepID=A0AA87RH16_9MICO|nr:MarR family transcriptional regulator [Agrococcus baldri]GEK80454.1 MarR family transcriptional regulator [Agrococcus baldri]